MRGLPLLGSLRMLSLGFLPQRQITYGLGTWPSRRRAKLFLSDLQRERMNFVPARMRYRALLDDKVRFSELVSSSAAIPRLLAVIEAGRVYPTSTDIPTADVDALADAARRLDGLVLKPRAGAFGRGVFLLVPADGRLRLNRELVSTAELEARIRCLDEYIVTSRARQAGYASNLFSQTTNTIRVVSMVDPTNGEVFVPGAAQRMGSEASFPLDNTANGGLLSIIDLASGRLSIAVRKDGTRHARHPDSGAQIEGVTIPRWRELLDSVRRLAQELDFIDYIGWDLVVTDEGFCVVEGNYNPGFERFQMHGPLLAEERVRAFFAYHLSLRPSRPSRQGRWCATEARTPATGSRQGSGEGGRSADAR